MQAIRACNQNCTLFARMSPTFAFVSRFKLAPIFWKKMTAAVQSFIQIPVHLFLSPGCTLHIYEWGLSHWNNTRRYWRSEAWKEFSPQKSWVLAIDWVRSVIMDVNFLFGTLSPKNLCSQHRWELTKSLIWNYEIAQFSSYNLSL